MAKKNEGILREPDELLVSGIDGAINLPFSGGFDKLDTIPKDKPVVVFCRVGDWSEQVAEILSDRGYDTSTLDGGYNAYREYISTQVKEPQLIDAERDNKARTIQDEHGWSRREDDPWNNEAEGYQLFGRADRWRGAWRRSDIHRVR